MDNQERLLIEIKILKQHLSKEYLKHKSLQHPRLIELSQRLDIKINEFLKAQKRNHSFENNNGLNHNSCFICGC